MSKRNLLSMRHLLAASLLFAAFACAAQEEKPPAGPADATSIVLRPERAPAAGEALWIEVFVGNLPANASLIVRDVRGGELGAIAPFGKSVREAGGSHLVPLPAELQREKEIELHFQLRHPAGARRPTAEELRRVELVYVPVSG